MNELSTEVKARETHENATVYYSRAEYNLYKHVMEVKKYEMKDTTESWDMK